MQKTRAILVDDDEDFLSALVAGLEPWAERNACLLVPCTSAKEALVELEREGDPVGFVLSDQRMPGISGSELLSVVSSRHPDVITMLLTAHIDLQNIADAVHAGIAAFIPKPCRPEYLRTELDKAVKVREIRRENDRFLSIMDEELRWGGELQKALLRLDLPSTDKIHFELSSLPLSMFHCGGDYHDVVVAHSGDTLFMVGDVAGHGVRAAFLTFFLRAAIRQGYLSKAYKPSPAGLLAWLNDLICDTLSSLPDMLITFSVFMFSEESGRLRFANAGHLPAFLVHEGNASPLPVRGPVLGFACGAKYSESSIELHPGDRIVLRTDGLREIGQDLFITDSAFETLLRDAAGPGGTGGFNEAVIEGVRRLAGGAPFSDDVTLLSAHIA